jgi:tetratricopeptide (TPR) repeat protein
MLRRCFRLLLLLSFVVPVLPLTLSRAQSGGGSQNGSSQNPPSNPSSGNPSPASSPSKSDDQSAAPADSKPAKPQTPDLSPPRSDRVNADDLGGNLGESSSKDTQIDLSPPENDAKAHPKSAEAIGEAEAATGGGIGVAEFHPWDPHKAAKSVEVGDFYFKRKNYRAAEDRYREALYYKDDDAVATFRLAVCLEKLERPNDALAEYQSYLRILPYGPQAGESKKAIERLKEPGVNAKQAK